MRKISKKLIQTVVEIRFTNEEPLRVFSLFPCILSFLCAVVTKANDRGPTPAGEQEDE